MARAPGGGPPEIQAEFPHLEFNYLPKENIYFRKSLLECNFMQALEGQFDSSHIGFLHSFVAQKKGAAGISGVSLGKSDAADSVRRVFLEEFKTQATRRRMGS